MMMVIDDHNNLIKPNTVVVCAAKYMRVIRMVGSNGFKTGDDADVSAEV